MTEHQPESPADELAKLKSACRLLGKVVVGQSRAMEAARIELAQGSAEKGMQWILNSLPDVWDDPETEWDGTETADQWWDRTDGFYRAAAGDEKAPAVPPAPVAAALDREALGRIVHETRLAENAKRDRPFRLEPWERRAPSQQEMDMKMAEAVAAAVLGSDEDGLRERAESAEAALDEFMTAHVRDSKQAAKREEQAAATERERIIRLAEAGGMTVFVDVDGDGIAIGAPFAEIIRKTADDEKGPDRGH